MAQVDFGKNSNATNTKGHMQNNINPGYGYRLVSEGEILEANDEYLSGLSGKWHKRHSPGVTMGKAGDGDSEWYHTRRKIEPPAGYEIVPENDSLTSDMMVFHDCDSERSWRGLSRTPWHDEDTPSKARRITFQRTACFARKIKEQPKVDPGYGYRLLGDDEKCIKGDDYCTIALAGPWHTVYGLAGCSRNNYGTHIAFRRKIDVGAGYRLLGASEEPVDGDEFLRRDWEPMTWCWSSWTLPTVADVLRENKQVYAIRRKIEAQPEKVVTLYGDYIVVAKDSQYRPATVPFIHDNEGSAADEAQRLARLHGGKFVVFKAVKAFERGEIPVNEVAA